MTIELTPAVIGIIMAILAHAATWIWFASKIATKVESLVNALSRIDKEMEKRDEQLTRLWERLDQIRDMLPAK